jgi:hypothetical protein
MSGQGKLPLFAQSESMFFLKVVDAQIEFGTDDKGPYLILHQGGRDMKAVRTSHTVAEKIENSSPRRSTRGSISSKMKRARSPTLCCIRARLR